MWELLAPAGSYESIKAAVNAGADAVYAGGSLFGARAYADNPDEEHLIRGIEYCHLHGCRLYLTVNTLLKEQELEEKLEPFLRPYWQNGVDGLIVQDLGVACLVRERFPGLPLHASTQMTVTGPEGARFLEKMGFTRVVPARELSLAEIRAITAETGLEVETFIHGAMCYCYSGQCLFSSLIGGRSGNRGRCAQPCRLPLRIPDGAGKESGSSCLLSMKDMCTLDLLPDILAAGVVSLKIEGRMKRPEYTAGVVSVYRKYLDLYQASGRDGYHIEESDRTLLLDLYNRGGFSGGYYRMHNGPAMMSMKRPNHMGTPALRTDAGAGLPRGGRQRAGYKKESGGFLQATALETLGKGDIIELAPGAEITLAEDVRRGGTVRLPAGKAQLPAGSILYRTKNARLLKRLEEEYVLAKRREPVRGRFVITADAPAVLTLECRGVKIECRAEIAEPAVNQPASAESVRRQMQKTGGTPFVFERLEITIADGLFVPLAKINELRRSGFERLCSAILRQRMPAQADHEMTDQAAEEPGRWPAGYPGEEPDYEISGRADEEPGRWPAGCPGKEPNHEMTGQADEEPGQLKTGCPGEEPDYEMTDQADGEAGWRPNARTDSLPGEAGEKAAPRVNVLVTTEQQLDAVLKYDGEGIDIIYLDSMFLDEASGPRRRRADDRDGEAFSERLLRLTKRIKERGYRCFLNCPPVLRSRDRELLTDDAVQAWLCRADGFLVHTVDQLAFFREFVREKHPAAQLVSDENLYALNRRAEHFLSGCGVSAVTLPAELNFRELMQLDREGAELVVYGYQPLMQSAQCVLKNTSGCTGIPSVTFLADRKNARFPVLNRCAVCCNTIFNSVPLMLCGCLPELKRLGLSRVRLSFTIESGQETSRILARCMGLLREGAAENLPGAGTTRGHFKRGVE